MTEDSRPAQNAATDPPDPARLERWLAAHVPGFAGPMTLTRFSGGQSNPTWRVDTPERAYVLRAKPRGALLPSAHAVDREFRVMGALAGSGVPVPEMRALCEDPEVMGRTFFVMEHVPGRIFFDQRLPDMSREERAAIFDDMNRVIARLHSLRPADVGLDDFGKHGAYMARQVARWTKQYRASETAPNPAMENLIAWLPEHLPDERKVGIIHGDFRLDNLMIHPTEPRIVAVLDWELSTLGDPMADFAYHALSWRVSPDLFRGLAGVDFAALGIPDERAYVARYLERTGQDWPEAWEFYLAFSLFRIAAILQGIAKRAEAGTAADPRAAETGALAVPLSELAWDLARRAGGGRGA
ncbi:phosphotransferase family protein [Rhodosalinus halophilus]|uniref:Phosphotransferase family protein n=1 Tax=Rhodosalinus halophilus TaxID=2259333 RepID=A0A365U8N4_9RHOB|nr:phosphotransferase [Rhodosalinus halophilus]RBI85151.1 phosphotransferase family protein [Rhodosalinus halophilus]